MILGKRLKELRTLKKLNQIDVANVLDIDRSTYGKYETGDSSPDYEKLIHLAEFFEVTTDYLLGRTDNPKGILDEPSELEIEHVLKNNQIMLDGEVLTEEQKEDILTFTKFVLTQERRKRQQEQQEE